MILTLTLTIIVEGVVIFAYCIWRREPLLSILITSVAANIVTQSMLWVVLNIFFRYYLATLLICEVFIWLFESVLIYLPNKNQLTVKTAVVLSLAMNAISFGLGWFLPV